MIGFIIFLIFLYFFIYKYSMNTAGTTYSLFNSALTGANFSNIKKIYSDINITLFQADDDGENFIFALKNNSTQPSMLDFQTLYEKAQKLHIHNKVFVSNYPVGNTSLLYKKLKELGIVIWDNNKLYSLANSTVSTNSKNTSSVLTTSDTSDDDCEIDDEPFNPIQDGNSVHSLLSLFGNKPEHL